MSVSDKRLAELKALSEQRIDTSDIPEVSDKFFETAKVTRPNRITSTTMRQPSVVTYYKRTGASTKSNEFGMRVMQERAYAKRGYQYLLIKSPPASGKSRALMFIALDKLYEQGLKQAIVAVPERSIGGSFSDEPLSKFGFSRDWKVEPRWNLCNAPGPDDEPHGSKVNAVGKFLVSDDKVLVCTHATFRFAVEELGIEAFDDRLIAIDEFHHVSAADNSVLGRQLGQLIARDKTHMVAMTGSYFRGDAVPVLLPEEEAKFETVTYTYFEQLNGYEHLKALDIGYYFYSGSYLNTIMKVLDPSKKTILHIPNVNSRESTGDKYREVNEILQALGDWEGREESTGFHKVRRPDGAVLKIADLVEDDGKERTKVINALKDPAQKNNRDLVDIIIALGMAKEGFDWIWCEHALTVGYRSSLTEIIQIIGRATRDAPGKSVARFTNLIAEPDASENAVTEAVNDTLKAIAASLLMEQVLAPRFNFTPKNAGPMKDFDYGEGGYDKNKPNVGFNEETGQVHIEIKGLADPKSEAASRICREDLNEVITAFVQDTPAIEKGLFDDALVPQELTLQRMGKIVRDKFPDLDAEDQEAVRQHAIAALNLTQKAREMDEGRGGGPGEKLNTALVDGIRKFAMDVRELEIDLIDSINPFAAAYSVLAKSMDEKRLRAIAERIATRRVQLSYEEARELALRALQFQKERGVAPTLTSQDAWERRMAEGVAALKRFKEQELKHGE